MQDDGPEDFFIDLNGPAYQSSETARLQDDENLCICTVAQLWFAQLFPGV